MTRYRAFVFFLLIVPLLFTGCKEPPEKVEIVRPVKAMQVSDPELIRSRPFPGLARAENRVNLSFRVGGPLFQLPINVGDQVKKGQVLARIDPRDFEVSLRTVKANLEKSKAALAFAKSDYARAERIQKADPGAISASMVDQKREQENRLVADVDSLKAQVEAAEDQLKYSHLEAPFDGVVVAKYFDNFEYVQAKEPVARILDTSRMEMVVDVPESLISYVADIDDIIVTLDAFSETPLYAKVKEIGKEASTTTRTFPVTLIMHQPPNAQILAGMTGEAKFVGRIQSDGSELSVLVPTSATFSGQENNRTFVWVIDPETKRVKKRGVSLGDITSNGVKITQGLKPGEWIATAGVHFLKEDMEVKLMPENEGQP